jgi:adenylate cyclase
MNFSSNTRKNIRFITVVVSLSIVFGIVFANTIVAGGFSPREALIGGLVGFLISFFCAVGNFTFLQRFRHLPFTAFLLLKSAYFTSVAATVVVARLFVSDDIVKNLPSKTKIIIIVLIVTLGLSFIVTFALMLRRMLGQNALLNFFMGRYFKPVEEERIFMFLDLSSSTEIAEKIGHLKFHAFLNEFFYDITDAIVGAEGEIYKYVGDEVIVSWRVMDRIKNSRCIQSFFEIQKSIEGKKDKYLNKFGYIPHFRAGIHCGPVIVGEMGDYKREIAFLGDTVNTTARIQAACKEYESDLLVSSEFLKKLFLASDYIVKSIGEIRLKGKEISVELFEIEKPLKETNL